MATTCLINNYNYARFVGDAIESALAQSVPFDEIVVVDDGSTDGSVDLLIRRYAKHPTVRIIAKEHQGQLSCFNEGFDASTGEHVFFLDADDLYEPCYVEQALEVYSRNPNLDFVFCGSSEFGLRTSQPAEPAKDVDLGYSVILVSYLRDWIGSSTSCLSMRRETLQKVLPLPFIADWQIRADDCLVFGSSLAGARKYFLAQPLVRRRVHEANRFLGRSQAKLDIYRRRLAINTLFAYFERKFCYDVARLADFYHHEFCTISQPTFHQLAQYLLIGSRSGRSLFRKLACMMQMTSHYLRPSKLLAENASESAAPDLWQSLPPLRLFAPTDLPAVAHRLQPRSSQRQAA